MDLKTLMMLFASVGMLLTLVTVIFKKHKSMWVTFLQHFCGFWFIFSGVVKAIDPIGTTYKNTEYFDNFELTFEPTAFGFLAPIFPWFNSLGNFLSIGIISLEIILGVALIIGFKRKLTAWIFFLLVLFFTFLTGFTYLTGYVPSDANFFEFGKWGDFVETQMRVTDCGCFGDFLKLKPYVSFWKDVFLLAPALVFLFFSGKMHELWTSRSRWVLFGLSALASIIFCISNTYWQEPVVDFRPFHEGSDIRERKALEQRAEENVEIIGWIFVNDSLGKTVVVENPNYMEAAKPYPKEQGWKVKDQLKSEPAIIQTTGYEIFNIKTQEQKTVNATNLGALHLEYPDSIWQVRKELGAKIPYESTKISDFSLTDPVSGSDPVQDILDDQGVSLWIVGYHFEGTESEQEVMVQDTVFATDTILVSKDSTRYETRIDTIVGRQETRTVFTVEQHYADVFKQKINPIVAAAKQAGYKVYGMATVQDQDRIADFKVGTEADYDFLVGDDKLLKTIIRSNPGIVVMKDGVILKKYHWKHIPKTLPGF